jgi:hypothetical protein
LATLLEHQPVSSGSLATPQELPTPATPEVSVHCHDSNSVDVTTLGRRSNGLHTHPHAPVDALRAPPAEMPICDVSHARTLAASEALTTGTPHKYPRHSVNLETPLTPETTRPGAPPTTSAVPPGSDSREGTLPAPPAAQATSMTALNLAVAPVVHTSPKAPCSPAAATATTPTAETAIAACTLIGHQPAGRVEPPALARQQGGGGVIATRGKVVAQRRREQRQQRLLAREHNRNQVKGQGARGHPTGNPCRIPKRKTGGGSIVKIRAIATRRKIAAQRRRRGQRRQRLLTW